MKHRSGCLLLSALMILISLPAKAETISSKTADICVFVSDSTPVSGVTKTELDGLNAYVTQANVDAALAASAVKVKLSSAVGNISVGAVCKDANGNYAQSVFAVPSSYRNEGGTVITVNMKEIILQGTFNKGSSELSTFDENAVCGLSLSGDVPQSLKLIKVLGTPGQLSVDDENGTVLKWKAPDIGIPSGYIIYRDGVAIGNAIPASILYSDMSYGDTSADGNPHKYSVTAYNSECVSEKAETEFKGQSASAAKKGTVVDYADKAKLSDDIYVNDSDGFSAAYLTASICGTNNFYKSDKDGAYIAFKTQSGIYKDIQMTVYLPKDKGIKAGESNGNLYTDITPSVLSSRTVGAYKEVKYKLSPDDGINKLKITADSGVLIKKLTFTYVQPTGGNKLTTPDLTRNEGFLYPDERLSLHFTRPIKTKLLTAEKFTVNNSAAVKEIYFSGEETTDCSISFTNLQEGQNYLLKIQQSLTDIYGASVTNNEVSFTVASYENIHIKNISFTSGGSLLTAPKAGEIGYSVNISAVGASAGILIVSVNKKDGQEIQTIPISLHEGENISTGKFTVSDASYDVYVYALDSASNMKFITQWYKFDSTGIFVPFYSHKPYSFAVDEFKAKYDIEGQKLSININGKAEQIQKGIVMLAKVQNVGGGSSDIVYALPLSCGKENLLSASEKLEKGKYVLSFASEKDGHQKDLQLVVSDQATTAQLLAELSSSSSAAEIKGILEDPYLGLDLSLYNMTNDKSHTAELFLSMRSGTLNTVADAQKILDIAAETVLLSETNDAAVFAGLFEKYAAKIGIDSDTLAKAEALSQTKKNNLFRILAKESFENETEFAADILDAIITTNLTDPDNKWSDIKNMVESEYKETMPYDFSELADRSADAATAYKKMIGFNADNIKVFADQLKKLLADQGNNNQGGGSGGGGGSSSGSRRSDVYSPVSASPTPIEKADFNDIDGVSWAKEAINSLRDKGIIARSNEYRPNDPITREEFVKITVLAFGYETGGTAEQFTDVPAGSWAQEYIATAIKNGIINGFSDKLFGYGANITREDTAVILNRILDKKASADIRFTDAAAISDYAKEAVNALSDAEIITGMDDGTFLPRGNTTRAQAAVLIYRTLNIK